MHYCAPTKSPCFIEMENLFHDTPSYMHEIRRTETFANWLIIYEYLWLSHTVNFQKKMRKWMWFTRWACQRMWCRILLEPGLPPLVISLDLHFRYFLSVGYRILSIFFFIVCSHLFGGWCKLVTSNLVISIDKLQMEELRRIIEKKIEDCIFHAIY